jgi:xanthine dehydrogenase accessory factor
VRELLSEISAWEAEGVGFGRAVVVRTFGSAPRQEGAVLLVGDDGRLAGSVSGGCVEGAVHEEVARARAEGRSRVVRYGISDEQAWSVGLACGGTVDVLVEPEVPVEALRAARETAAGRVGGRAVVIPLPPDAPGPEAGPHPTGPGAPRGPVIVGHEDARLEGSLGSPTADTALRGAVREALLRGRSRSVEVAGRWLFVEAYPLRPRLVIVGAVQTAVALVRLARELGYETVVIDGRPAFATRERFPDADQVIVAWADDVAEEIGLGPADAVAVLSHDPKFDDPAILSAARRGCRYIGAVGSRRTQQERRERLGAAGLAAEELARLRGPIGLDLGGRSPAEMALAILAEVVAERYAATGEPLSRRLAVR